MLSGAFQLNIKLLNKTNVLVGAVKEVIYTGIVEDWDVRDAGATADPINSDGSLPIMTTTMREQLYRWVQSTPVTAGSSWVPSDFPPNWTTTCPTG